MKAKLDEPAVPGVKILRSAPISEVKQLLEKMKPIEEWMAKAPRSQRDIELYRRVLAGLQKMLEDPWARVEEFEICHGSK